jgi:hypothetical protein
MLSLNEQLLILSIFHFMLLTAFIWKAIQAILVLELVLR